MNLHPLRRLAVIGALALAAPLTLTTTASAQPTMCMTHYGPLAVTIDMNLGDDPALAGDTDVILGTPGDDVIETSLAHAICSGEGDDHIIINPMNGLDARTELITAGPGDDRIELRAGDEVDVSGGPGNDVIIASWWDDTEFILRGDEGNDRIINRGGQDLYANSGSLIYGGEGRDIIVGGLSPDWIDGGDGNDLIFGRGGDDRIDGSDGIDRCFGGAGTNTIVNCERRFAGPKGKLG